MSKTITTLSLGAGVQSTTLLLLSAEGVLPKLDAALFADTGWEPRAVYDHLNRIDEEIAKPAGIPIQRISWGSLRDNTLDPTAPLYYLPAYLTDEEGKGSISRRQCTKHYKIVPIQRATRLLLGAKVNKLGHIGSVPKGAMATQWIGISTDEVHRAKDSQVSYMKNEFPLLDLGWSREHCLRYLEMRGWATTPKSACVGCPFHSNQQWRDLRDNHPDEWRDAIEFDEAIRNGYPRALAKGQKLRGTMYLHKSRKPLAEADIDAIGRKEVGREPDLFLDGEIEFSCSPFACRADEIDLLQIETTPRYSKAKDQS